MISVRGIESFPTTLASSALSLSGAIKAALAVLPFLAAAFFAAFAGAFAAAFAGAFFGAADLDAAFFGAVFLAAFAILF
jgi:uncharacterized membrane protein YjgN (DUF898 family)